MDRETVKRLLEFNDRARDLVADMLTEKQCDELVVAVTESEKAFRIAHLEGNIAKMSAELATLREDKK